MTIRTHSGKELQSDKVTSTKSPPFLFIHLIDIGLDAAVSIFTGQDELPIEGHESFTVFKHISGGDGDVNVVLTVPEE